MENKIEKMSNMWLMLVWIYIAAAVYILLYGDFFLKEIITSAIGAALIISYLVRSALFGGMYYYGKINKNLGS